MHVAGPDGTLLKVGLKGWHGLAPLSLVVVKGVVGPRPDPGVLVIEAKEIFVEK